MTNLNKVPEGWEVKELGEVSINLDYKRIPLSSQERKNRHGEYRYYGAQGIIDYIDDYIFDGKYLLIAEDGENLKSRKNNIAFFVRGKFWVNNHAHVLKNNDLSNLRYLYYVMNFINIKPYLTGSAQPKLNQQNLKKIKIPLPPLPEQEKIADILGSIDDQIENLTEQNKILEEIAKTIFKRWFIDFEFPNEEGKPYKSSGGEFIDSELGKIPKGWRVFKFGELIEFIKGKKPKALKNEYEEGLLPYLSIDYLNGNMSNLKYASPKNVIISNEEDILMVMDGASSGKVYIGKEGIVSSTIAKVNILNNRIKKDIIYFYLLFFEEKIKTHTTGSAIPHVDKKYVFNLKIALPTENYLIKKLNSILRNYILKILNNNNQIQTLTQLRNT